MAWDSTAVEDDGATDEGYISAAEWNTMVSNVSYKTEPTINIANAIISVVSAQVDHDSLKNFASNEHFTEASIDFNRAVTTKTAAYNPAVNRDIVLMNGTYTVTLNGSPVLDDTVDVKNIGTGTVTIDGNGNNIDNSATLVLYGQNESVSLVFDGSNWWII